VILIGQYDSPFVRRAAIAMRLYGIAFEHRPWSTFGDGDKVAEFNPLRRVPTLVLDDGDVLIESTAILDYLDELVGPSKAMIPDSGRARREALRICALGTGLGDKAVALFYERVMHKQTSETWVKRCRMQISSVLMALDQERSKRTTAYWFDETMGHADIAVACALCFVSEAHPGTIDVAEWPSLAAHATKCEATEPFKTIYQPFIPPA
jgi:glutathione S-transferase